MAGITIPLLLFTSISLSNLFIIPTHQFPMPKFSQFTFFFYDKPSTPNATTVTIVPPTSPTTFFGGLVIIDDALLAAPQINAKVIGRAQGVYAGADMKKTGLLMVLNYVFTTGKYKGSSLSILGRNEVLLDTREMSIVGGTGQFRLARGFALAHTVWFTPANGDAMVQYNVTVFH